MSHITKPKVLGIQFRLNQNSVDQEQLSLRRELGAFVDLEFVSALDDAVAWDGPVSFTRHYSGFVLGGSGDFDFDGGRADDDEAKHASRAFLRKLTPLLAYILEHDVPTFGICYGHQMLGAFSGAQVVCDASQKKTASHQITILEEGGKRTPVYSDVPDSFYAHYAHKDVVDRVPTGAVLLAHGGEKCKVSALRYRSNIYTTQFHPELNYADLMLRMKAAPQYLPEGVTVEQTFKDDARSSQLLHNFGRQVVEYAKNAL